MMIGKKLLTLLMGATLALVAGVLLHVQVFAATQTVNVFPNYDISLGNWTDKSGGADFWGRIHRQTSARNNGSWICSKNSTANAIFGAGATENPGGAPAVIPNIQQGVVAMSAETSGKTSYKFLDFSYPNITLQVLLNGSVIGTATANWPNNSVLGTDSCTGTFGAWQTTTVGTVTASVGSEWTQSQIDTLQFGLSRSGNARSTRVMSMYAQLSYITYSTLTQNGYRFYQNANSVTPGTALGGSATTPVDFNRDLYGNAFRLRTAIQTTNERWLRQYGTYKLQYANKGIGSCSAPTGGWTDVGTGDIQWQANGGAANGADIAVVGGEPGGTMTPQRYQSANPFGKRQQVATNAYGLWDFSLRYAGSSYGSSYCFRVVNSDGNTQPLSGYTNYPEIRITGDLSMSFVNASGTPIGTPSVPFSGLTAMGSCQTSTGTLGTNTERLRLTDNRGTGNWTISIAATGGAGAKWNSGTHQYSFNDSAGSPSGCANGQLSMDFGAIGAAPKSGCTATGLAPGSNGAFTGGTSMIIGSGTNADRFCYWDITSIGLSQRVPMNTQPGAYSLNMTITVVAM